MKQVNVIRHLAFEDLGSFAAVFARHGLQVNYLEAGVDDLSGLSAGSSDLLIVLGGPISANDVDDFAFLQTEIELLKQRIQLDKPTLGICLGAQLIARAMGAGVYPGLAKEIGWQPIQLSDAGKQSPLAALSAVDYRVLHWHGEIVDLPDNAVCLAATDITANQAFQAGNNVLALQFHIEVTRVGMEQWFIGHIGEIEQTNGVSVAQLRQDTMAYAQSGEIAGQAVLEQFFADFFNSP